MARPAAKAQAQPSPAVTKKTSKSRKKVISPPITLENEASLAQLVEDLGAGILK